MCRHPSYSQALGFSRLEVALADIRLGFISDFLPFICVLAVVFQTVGRQLYLVALSNKLRTFVDVHGVRHWTFNLGRTHQGRGNRTALGTFRNPAGRDLRVVHATLRVVYHPFLIEHRDYLSWGAHIHPPY